MNVGGSTENLTEKADAQFINADFEGGMSVPTALFKRVEKKVLDEKTGKMETVMALNEKTGQMEQVMVNSVVNAYKNFGGNGKLVFKETIGGVGNVTLGLVNGTLPKYAIEAFSDKGIEKYPHRKAKEKTGKYIDSGLISTISSGAIETAQYPYYSLTYILGLQNDYDPMGLWNENSSRPKPALSGMSYARDMRNDVVDMYNGSQGNFNYLNDHDK